MQVQIADEAQREELLEGRENSIHIKFRPNLCEIASFALSAAILLGMLAVEWLPYRL
jgi:hypothetical protein